MVGEGGPLLAIRTPLPEIQGFSSRAGADTHGEEAQAGPGVCLNDSHTSRQLT